MLQAHQAGQVHQKLTRESQLATDPTPEDLSTTAGENINNLFNEDAVRMLGQMLKTGMQLHLRGRELPSPVDRRSMRLLMQRVADSLAGPANDDAQEPRHNQLARS